MEMTAVWKERKAKALSLSSHTALESSQNRELPTFPQPRRRLGISFFSQLV